MKNQLEQLEDCIKRLVLKFNSVLTEKEKLSRQVGLLKDQLHKQVISAQMENEQLIKQYEQEKFHLQEIMQSRIDDLILENNRLKSVLENSRADLQQLLQRLPLSQEDI